MNKSSYYWFWFCLSFILILQGILGPKKELWDLFQMVEKWSYEAQDITASVRDLPTVKYVEDSFFLLWKFWDKYRE